MNDRGATVRRSHLRRPPVAGAAISARDRDQLCAGARGLTSARRTTNSSRCKNISTNVTLDLRGVTLAEGVRVRVLRERPDEPGPGGDGAAGAEQRRLRGPLRARPAGGRRVRGPPGATRGNGSGCSTPRGRRSSTSATTTSGIPSRTGLASRWSRWMSRPRRTRGGARRNGDPADSSTVLPAVPSRRLPRWRRRWSTKL